MASQNCARGTVLNNDGSGLGLTRRAARLRRIPVTAVPQSDAVLLRAHHEYDVNGLVARAQLFFDTRGAFTHPAAQAVSQTMNFNRGFGWSPQCGHWPGTLSAHRPGVFSACASSHFLVTWKVAISQTDTAIVFIKAHRGLYKLYELLARYALVHRPRDASTRMSSFHQGSGSMRPSC